MNAPGLVRIVVQLAEPVEARSQMDNSRAGRALCSLWGVGTFVLFATHARADETCVLPIQPVDTSHPTTVVGTGTQESCTEEALDQALSGGGVITFDCGGEATIFVTSQKDLRVDVDTTLDGQGQITLDGNGVTRLLSFVGPSFRYNTTTVTLQVGLL